MAASATPLAAARQLRTAVELTLGDDVRYSGSNLDTTVTGELRVATEPNAPRTRRARCGSTARTTRMARSSSSTAANSCSAARSTIPGSTCAPSAARDDRLRSNVTEVGVELTGTLKAPRTRVFSTPAMSEADALSYLLFGRPASGSDAGMGTEETSALQTAALSLGLQQALPVVQRIGNTLGLDELTVQSTTTDAGALMAGKYLSPRVYIRYSYGLFNRIGGFLLRFKVNDRLSIETRSGEQESMDLFYTIEKD